MSTGESFGNNMQSIDGVEATPPSVSVTPLHVSQIEALAAMLSRAFHHEPNFTYIMPDDQARRRIMPWFFLTVVIPASRLYGEIYTTKQVSGGSLWISPGGPLGFERMVRTGMQAIPFKLDEAGFRRWINLGAQLEKVRHRLATGPHWYLLALGVEATTTDGNALRGAHQNE
jgi:hypothetical protein